MAGQSVGQAASLDGSDNSVHPSPEEIRAQLAKILGSRIFIHSERLRRFLKTTVERALAGKGSQIKEYTLGRDVFDRDQNFDPRVDSIVRVEARRLRAKLRQYYQDQGTGDPVVISFRKGSYVPLFRPAVPPEFTASAIPAHEAPVLDSRTIAVLPFVNLSPDPDQEFFCDGITEDILDALSTVPDLNVVSRTSVFHFKGKSADVREIGEKLGAGTVVEGSVRKAGDRLRISAKAVNASSGVLLWSDTFDRSVEDVFAVQDEIARAIADSLRVTLLPSKDVFASARSSGNLEAYVLYRKARQYWYQMSREGPDVALREFSRVISQFPGYAPAYASLADAYTHLTFWGAVSPSEGTSLAKQAALAALRLDDRLAEAYASLGAIVSCFEWHWEAGAKLLKRSLELQPSNSNAHNFYAFYFLCRGQFPEAMACVERVQQLDPLSPRAGRIKGWSLYFERKYNRAIDSLKTTLSLDNRNSEARFLLAYAYLRKSMYDEALQELFALPEGPFSATKWGALGEVYAICGKTVEAYQALNKLESLAKTDYVSPISRLSIYAGLGDWGQVLDLLERAYAESTPWLCLLKIEPRYDPIRSHPRVVSLLERMQLA